jgi:Na+/proline symporter
MPTLLNDPSVFPVWVADFLLVAMIAAAMSSMDSVLLVAATVFHRDLVGIVRPATDPMSWTRWAVVGIAVVSAWIALRPPGGIVEITIFSGSLYAVCFLPAILLGLHWRKGTARAVLASMLVGTVVLLAWLLTGLGDVLHEVFPALAASCLTYVIIALNSPPALDRWPTPADQA